MKSLNKWLAFAALGLFAGCGETAAPPKVAEHAEEGEHGHDHAEGPHNGQIIELGDDEYHAELLHDDATHTVTIYLLDAEAKKSVTSAEQELTVNVVADGKPAQYTLAANPQTEDPSGESSRFSATDEALCKALDAEGATGRLSVTIAGKPYSGKFDHAEHEHDHEH